MADKKFKCIKPYVVKSYPKNHHVEVGEIVTLEGFLMGRDPVFILDVEKHPPEYKHLTHCSFVMFSDVEEHFIPV